MKIKMQFKPFVINEEQVDLFAKKIGDILESLHSMQEDFPQMGTRMLIRTATNVAEDIRDLLKYGWEDKFSTFLNTLKKDAFAIFDAIDNNGDLKNIVDTVTQDIENISRDLSLPIS